MRKQGLRAHKFDHLLDKFVPKHSLLMKLVNGTAHKGKLNAIYRTCTAYTEGEISGI